MKFNRVAIVYDWIDKWGGVERVLLTLHEIFPKADFFTSYYDPKTASWAKDLSLRSSFIQKLPKFIKKNRILSLPFYPYAFESFNFKEYDLVISVTSSFAKSVITRPETLHICYLLTPTRYLWVCPDDYIQNPFNKTLAKPVIKHLKTWDYIASRRPDKIISISKTVADKCQKYYELNSDIIYPPFDIEYWERISAKCKTQSAKLQFKTKKYYLVVSRLEYYKKVDLVVKVFNRLADLNLVIIGKGSQLKKLKKMAKSNISFIESVTDEKLSYYYSHAEALIMPQEEDFGYVSLEAQFFGCPVIAYKKGGATETILDGKTGIFFDTSSEEDLIKALARFSKVAYNLKKSTKEFGTENIARFSKNKFINNFQECLMSLRVNVMNEAIPLKLV